MMFVIQPEADALLAQMIDDCESNGNLLKVHDLRRCSILHVNLLSIIHDGLHTLQPYVNCAAITDVSKQFEISIINIQNS